MCPDENTIAGYVQGILPQSGVREVEAHIDACVSCREVMSELGRVVGAMSEDRGVGYQDTLLAADAPRRVGRYTVESLIGRGGMGEVLLAVDPVLHRRVALKLIRPDALGFGADQEAEERLVREARAMATLAHPNVVTVYDAGVYEGQIFLAMEYVEGVTFAYWLAAEAPDWKVVVDRFLDAGRGLAAAHDAGILHRDFKPHNVLIGFDGRVRVTDFGLARSLSAPAGEPASPHGSGSTPPDLTMLGAVVGTPAYMSPEQLHGQPVDQRSDVFSFCVALFEALFGVRPYDAPTLEGMRWQMTQGRMHAAPNTRGVPSPLIRVMHQGLSIAPAARPPSMHALLLELERAAGGEQHVKVHLVCQALFTFCHALVGAWFVYDVYLRDGTGTRMPPSTSTPGAAGPDSTPGFVVALGIVWVLMAMFFLFGGTFWAALNTFGLATRRRWARVTTLIYGIFALTSCIGIPYGAYAIWSLTRAETKRSLSR